MFATPFSQYVFPSDTIECFVDGFYCIAKIELDIVAGTPDKHDEGFWPSLDPNAAGFIGPDKNEADLKAAHEEAAQVLAAWSDDLWFYCGVVVSVSKAGIDLTPGAGHSLWGVECNYPAREGVDNSYLLEAANELLPEALEAARAKIAELCAPAPQANGGTAP